MPRPVFLYFFGSLALMLSACELRVGIDVTVAEDGSGAFELAVALDAELAELLVDAGADPLQGLDELRASVPQWTIVDDQEADGGRGVRFSTTFESAVDLSARTDELHASLDTSDGRLFRGLDLTEVDGELWFTGEVGLVPPEVPGATGTGVAFDGDDLRRLLDERGDEFVRYDVRITFPSTPSSHDGDDAAGETVVWRAPIGEMRAISAAAPTSAARNVWIIAAVVGVAGTAAALLVVAIRLRVARRARYAA